MLFDGPVFFPTGKDILVVSRPKLIGLGKHFGVDFQNGTVVHFTDKSQIEFVTIEQFAQSRDVTIERLVPNQKSFEIRDRLIWLMQNPQQYRLGDWNCETFTTWLTEGKAASAQVNGFAAIAAVLAVLAAVQRVKPL